MFTLSFNKYLLSIYSVPGPANKIKSSGGDRAVCIPSIIAHKLSEEKQSRVKGLDRDGDDVSVGWSVRPLKDRAFVRRPDQSEGVVQEATCSQSFLGGGNSKYKALRGSMIGSCGGQNSKAGLQDPPPLVIPKHEPRCCCEGTLPL